MSILQRHVIFTHSDGGKGPKLQLDLCSVEYCAKFTLVLIEGKSLSLMDGHL